MRRSGDESRVFLPDWPTGTSKELTGRLAACFVLYMNLNEFMQFTAYIR